MIPRKKWLPLCLLALLAPVMAYAYVSEENFDTNWVPDLPHSTATSGTNPVTGWISSNTRIFSSFGSDSSPNAAAPEQNGWVQSPTLSNGAGAVYFYVRGPSSSSSTGVVEITTDDVTWKTNGSLYIVSGSSFQAQTNAINTNVSVKIRLRRLSSTSPWAVDTVAISAPPPTISITNIVTSPSRPADLDPVTISAGIGVQGINSGLWATNYWRVWPATNWTAIPMVTNASGNFETTSTISGSPIGTLIEYYISATCLSDGTPYPTNSAATSFIVRPQSGYTNMLVTGQINTNLLLGANYSWQNIVTLSNSVNPTFRFQGHSNAVATLWGDSNQSASNIPAYGTADINATNIVLAGTNTGSFVFGFNENTRAYSVMACDTINFNTWTSTTYNAFGNYTNGNWIVVGGSTTNDPSRSFSGRTLILNGQQGLATNTYLLSPSLTNGIGQISFWYRNWATNASPTASFNVQVAPATTSVTWTTIATVTNIISTNHLFFSVGRSDRDNQAVRILNNPAGANSRLCIDDVAIARPGAGVAATSITNVPANPTILDTVTISATLSPLGGATITNLILWYRSGTNGMFDTTTMSSTNGTFWTNDIPIPHAPTGTVQYTFLCYFSGFQSESASPVWIPSNGTNNPASYQVTTPPDNRSENFDSNWIPTPLPWTIYQPGTNTVTGWTVKDARITGGFGTISSPYAASLTTAGDAWIQTPLLSNGVGSLNFYAKRGSAEDTNPVLVEVSYDSDTNFTFATNFTLTSTFQSYSFPLDLYSNLYVRVRRELPGSPSMTFDDIFVPLPPADVLITNVLISPGYPSTGSTVTVTCNVSSRNPFFPAWGISPTLNYRRANDTSFTTLTMTRVSGTTYATTPFTIPAYPRDTIVEYFIRCDFKGYYGTPGDDRSPRFFPSGGSNDPANYAVRHFASSFSNLSVVVNDASQTARLLADNSWQTVVNLGTTTNTLSVSFAGSGYATGSGYLTNDISWGLSNSWQTALPLSDTAGTNQTPHTITGSFDAGQYLLRFDESSGEYLVIPCVWQDFDAQSGTTNYQLMNFGAGADSVSTSFNDWTTNIARMRKDSFSDSDWVSINYYTNGAAAGTARYVIYGAKIVATSVQLNPDAAMGSRWVAQPLDESGTLPFRGIGSITYQHRAQYATPPYSNTTLGVYLIESNYPHASNYGDFTAVGIWNLVTNHFSATNSAFTSRTITLQTNIANNVIFSQDTGSNTVYFDEIEIQEWYSQSVTNSGWIAAHAWIERKSFNNNICRLEASRANPFGSEQYLQSPLLTNGINKLSFSYSAGANSNVSFDVQLAFNIPAGWSNIDQVTSSPGTNYYTASYTLQIPPTNAYIRIKNTTPKPGSLLLDDINISAYVQGASWQGNNAAIDANSTFPRQFYAHACYLNSNRTSNIATDLTKPLTNTYPYIRTPQIFGGIGEISFWYRNWAVSGATIPPANIVVQTCLTDSTNDLDWTTVGFIPNVINTNDYLYFQTSVYDTASQYVRIYNDDVTVTNAGRICLDDILITAPMAATLSMSNLVVTPSIPLYSNTVDVIVDVHHLFLAPSNITLSAWYATATNYAGLSSASLSNLTMSCIASNLDVRGKWYRYKTTSPIPTNAIDTHVKYFAKASFAGYHTEITSPKTNKLFGAYPTWYDPMNAINGTNQAYYVVYSCPTGSVWINEINCVDLFDGETPSWTNEFIELCGPAGANIGKWSLEIYDQYLASVTNYTISAGTVITASTNNRGFWTLSDAGVAITNMLLSYPYPEFLYDYPADIATNQNLPFGGALVLKRSFGAIEYKVSYNVNLTSSGYPYIGSDYGNINVGSLGLRGSGTNYSDFGWSELSGHSPGQQNGEQTIQGGLTSQNEPPVIVILSFRVNTNVWIICNTTNNWFPVPWYTTNLLAANSWTNVPVFSRSIVTTNCTINFDKPTNSTPFFYKVQATNSP